MGNLLNNIETASVRLAIWATVWLGHGNLLVLVFSYFLQTIRLICTILMDTINAGELNDIVDEKDFARLLGEYRKIWNNRLLEKEGESNESILKEAIIRELRDENSHPRVRKPVHSKYYSAVKRILDSSLDIAVKLELIELHTDIVELLP